MRNLAHFSVQIAFGAPHGAMTRPAGSRLNWRNAAAHLSLLQTRSQWRAAPMSRLILIATAAIVALSLIIVAGWVAVAWTVETPPYQVADKSGALELRDYPALRVAEITRQGSRRDAVRAGFSPLARYIFARERAGDSIAMTAPVTQVPQGGDSWTVQFIMPAEYSLDRLPAPGTDTIRLAEWPARRMAAIRFSGVATDASVAAAEDRLRAWMAEQGLQAEAAPIYAYYNDPLTPGFLRRNEVLIPVAGGPAA
jgi:effector-binding domain-containing protein